MAVVNFLSRCFYVSPKPRKMVLLSFKLAILQRGKMVGFEREYERGGGERWREKEMS